MAKDPKKSRFRSFFVKKEKDYNLSYTKREQPILDELAKLPPGSKYEVALRTKLQEAKTKAANQESPRKDMEALLKAAKKAVAMLGEVAPESYSSSAIQTEEAMDKQNLGEGEKCVVRHRNDIAQAYAGVRKDVANLKTLIKRFDTTLDAPKLDFDTRVNEAEKDAFSYAALALMPVAKDLDTRLTAGDIDGQAHEKGLVDLKSSIDQRLVIVQTRVNELKEEIADAANDPGAIRALAEGAAEAQQIAKDKIAFDKALAEVDKLVSVLEDWDHPSASDYRDGVNIQRSTPPSNYALETEVLIRTKAELEQVTRMHSDGYKKKAAEVAKKYKGVKATLELLFISTAMDGTAGAYVEAMRDQCIGELEAIALMIGTGSNEAALNAASDMLDALEKRARAFDQNFDEVSDVTFIQWDCDKALASKSYAKACPDMQERLKKKSDALIAASGKMEQSAAIEKFKALRDEITGSQADSYVSTAKARIEWLKGFEKRAKEVQGEFAKLLKALSDTMVRAKGNKDLFKSYEGPMVGELEAARQLAGKEAQDSMDLADTKLKAVTDRTRAAIDALVKDPKARDGTENELCIDMMREQSDGVDAAKKREEDLKTFKKLFEMEKDRLEVTELYVNNKPQFTGELNAIRQLLKKSKEVMESTHDLDRAKGVIDAVKKRRLKLEVDSRRPPTELATIAKDWNSATGQMLKAFKELQKSALSAVADAEDDELTAAAGTIEAKMKEAAGYLTNEKFLDEMNFYSKDGIDPADLRRQREKTLNKIKLLREYLSNDPLLRAAQNNPFDVTSVIGPVFMKLRDIEHKVMVSG